MSEEIVELNDVQHARIRTEMYLGSRVPSAFVFPVVNIMDQVIFKEFTIVPAVLTAFREALDNSLDELSFVGKGKIDVEYQEGVSEFLISDSGRGIPIDWREASDMHTATLAVSRAKAGRNFGERGEQAGTNGLGISIVNFVSKVFTLEVKRDKKHFIQTFISDDSGLNAASPEIVDDKKQKETGTTVCFRLDPSVFKEGLDLPSELIKSLLVFVATSNPHISFTYNGETVFPLKKLEKTGIVIPFEKDGVGSGKFIVSKKTGEANSFTFVNNVPAYNGGTHLDEFKNHFPKHLLTALAKESKKRKLNPSKSDVLDSVDIIGFVKMKGPNFDSQSKTRLTNSEIRNPIFHSFASVDWVKELAKNKELVEAIYELCAFRTGKQDKSQVDANAKALKKAKIAKLVDANSRFRDQCVLFLAEGDSAAGGMMSVRDPNYHAMLPLRGKVRNVLEVSAKDVIGEKESVIKDICAAIGLTPGKPADRKSLRYSKVYLMADADEDGQGSICPLLVNFFYRFWPELFEDEPFIHIFMTPLIILTKGKERKYFYPVDMDKFNPKDWKGWDIKRAKGLGSMMPENFKDHIDNPLSIGCLEDGNKSLEKLMSLLYQGNRANDRKAMMEISVDDIIDRLKTMGKDWSATGVNEIDI